MSLPFVRRSVLAAAAFVCAALFIGGPLAYDFVYRPDLPTLPYRVIGAAAAASRGPARWRLNLPETARMPSLWASDGNRIDALASLDLSLDELTSGVIRRPGTSGQPDVDALLAALQPLEYRQGNVFGDGGGRFASWNGSASDTAYAGRMLRRDLLAGGGGVGGGIGGVSGGPGLSGSGEIPQPGAEATQVEAVSAPSIEDESVTPDDQNTNTPGTPNGGTGGTEESSPDVDQTPQQETATPVPEPTTLILTGIGLGGFIAARARKRS